jgi:hypothetical protein
MLRSLAALGFLAAAATAAHAQAPGEVAPTAPSPAPGFVVAGPAPVDVMGNRWAVGLSIGSLALAPKGAPEAKTEFGVGELSLRFRATPHLEVEAAFGGGREQLPDGMQGTLEARTGLVSLRYRFNPAGHWNWWLGGGVGGIQIAQHGSPDQAFRDSERPIGALAIGLERRWQQFALHAELRGVRVGERRDQVTPQAQPAASQMPGGSTPPPPPTTTAIDQKVGGGMFTIGASYYF